MNVLGDEAIWLLAGGLDVAGLEFGLGVKGRDAILEEPIPAIVRMIYPNYEGRSQKDYSAGLAEFSNLY